ncbi:uncharacterized protein PADG_07743 [Paracoccidioides brasiliensis Pb18]|uniref:Uncharacterized protein n=1 Tax=Paracoccidioides brasiliensis (strain Pb18) TaxID=502780 RepID=C1GKF7_PARBD|nr:uncharacterized protein PADG_07743 [Paracoccidioides brasiliensis Pb18]EEH42923.2 hypothetical protein PADG_07743 [Paracoccidioides brasiliensis Pb18]
MSDKVEAGPVEREFTKPSFGARLKANFKKWWWLYLALFIVVVLVILLPVIFVGYPRIAQKDVNKSTLTINSMEITNPAPEAFNIKVDQTIGSKSKYHPILDAFNATVSIAKSNKPFFVLAVPSVKAVDGAKSMIDQRVQLADVQQFVDYSIAVMKSEFLDLEIDGRTGLKEGALPKTTVDYNKVITMKGLNGLKGFNVTDFNLVPKEGDGTNMLGEVFIPNPSVLTLTLGDVTLNLSVDGKEIGTSTLPNLVIKPGNNTVKMRSAVDVAKVFPFVSGKDAKYKNGVIPVSIVGKSAIYNGKELPYFTKALESNVLHIQLNLGPLLGLKG